MRAYVINLDTAKERWSFIERAFAGTKFNLCRISGVDGNALKFPIESYSEGLYRWFHGRPTNPRHVGCYLSHVKAMEAFLATSDEHALIAEDDLVLRPDFEAALEAALSYSRHWNILRLTGLSRGRPASVARLCGDYSLCISFGRLKGTGAYVLDRAAAHAWVARLLPMRLPIDHALDREWFYGLRAMYILPFPAYQTESGFFSSIHLGESMKLSALRRSVTTYPYQALNEATRWLLRALSYLRMKLTIMFSAKPRNS
jgi:glycosyl transferase family 25